MEGEGGGVEVMLIGAPDWEGGDPSMMSSESTVDRGAGQIKGLTLMISNCNQSKRRGEVKGEGPRGGGESGLPEVDRKFCSTMPTFTS